MPTYEYECLSCGYVFEKSQNISDMPLETCPQCAQKVKRLISTGGGLIFKGSGFYATDYHKKSPGEPVSNKPTCPMVDNKCCDGCSKVK